MSGTKTYTSREKINNPTNNNMREYVMASLTPPPGVQSHCVTSALQLPYQTLKNFTTGTYRVGLSTAWCQMKKVITSAVEINWRGPASVPF